MKRLLVLVLALALSSITLACNPAANHSAAQSSPTPTPVSTTPATPTPTPVSSPSPTPSGTPTSMVDCFPHVNPADPTHPGPDYDQFHPTLGAHCMGTRNQQIDGIQKVVFLGDSVTEGTPPTAASDIYRARLTAALQQKFGTLEVWNCSKWGATTDDFLGGDQQLAHCFPFLPEQKKTLVVFTMGGNDIAHFAKQGMAGTATTDQLLAQADVAVQKLRDAIGWLQDPQKFPNGTFIVFGDNYEFTDGMGDPSVCPAASLFGFGSPWPDGRPVVLHFNEQYMRTAMETQTDLVFMLERFCGHGYNHANPANECYAPGNDLWFDLTCIHPNPTGHAQLSDMFMTTVNGG